MIRKTTLLVKLWRKWMPSSDNLLDLFITGMSVYTIQTPVRLCDYAVVVIKRREPLSKRSGAVTQLIENNSSTSTPVWVGSTLSPQIPTSPVWVSPIAYLQAQLHSVKNISLQAICTSERIFGLMDSRLSA